MPTTLLVITLLVLLASLFYILQPHLRTLGKHLPGVVAIVVVGAIAGWLFLSLNEYELMNPINMAGGEPVPRTWINDRSQKVPGAEFEEINELPNEEFKEYNRAYFD